jgi:hypothetical protein
MLLPPIIPHLYNTEQLPGLLARYFRKPVFWALEEAFWIVTIRAAWALGYAVTGFRWFRPPHSLLLIHSILIMIWLIADTLTSLYEREFSLASYCETVAEWVCIILRGVDQKLFNDFPKLFLNAQKVFGNEDGVGIAKHTLKGH